MSEKISLEVLNHLDEKGMFALLITNTNEQTKAIEGLTAQVTLFTQMTAAKLDKSDFFEYKKEIDANVVANRERVVKLENANENREISKKTLSSFGSSVWSVVLGAIVVFQFIIIVAQALLG